ncbi:GxxExxY protein [Granulicella sp. S156]|uniref:GxxExxY protein n=1 Tax=Granulicella sp. S156 TaxID=1747224 RepID=UPI00131D362D|nr:GxxExxY protein [Granulicella sp. S156]
MTREELNALAERTLDAAYRIHSTFGPGLLESAYTACLVFELHRMGLDVKTEVPVPIVYEDVKLSDVGYRIDILVGNELVIEVKSLEAIAPVHLSQLVSYLKLSNRRLGLLLNFNVERLKDGIYRRVNGF